VRAAPQAAEHAHRQRDRDRDRRTATARYAAVVARTRPEAGGIRNGPEAVAARGEALIPRPLLPEKREKGRYSLVKLILSEAHFFNQLFCNV